MLETHPEAIDPGQHRSIRSSDRLLVTAHNARQPNEEASTHPSSNRHSALPVPHRLRLSVTRLTGWLTMKLEGGEDITDPRLFTTAERLAG